MNTLPFPNENIDPKLKKQPKFLLEYANAAWGENFTGSFQKMFWRNRARYEEIKDYTQGKQNITKYKPLMGVEEADSETWLKIDWTPRQILPKFREIAIGKIADQMYNTNCTPIDPVAKSELDKYFADIQAKIVMKDTLKKVGSPLQHAAVLQPKAGEPSDEMELKMNKDFGAKTQLAMEAELGVEVIFNENDIVNLRKEQITQVFDYGFGIYKDYLDENMRVRARVVDGRFFGCNYCRKSNFSDMTRAYEITYVSLPDLAVVFPDAKIIDEIKAVSLSRNYANAGTTGNVGWIQGYDPTKAAVMDLEFISYDIEVKEIGINSKGNVSVSKSDYQNRNNNRKTVTLPNGKTQPAYNSKKVKNVYKIKWVIGTEYCYDYGLATNVKRDNNPQKANDVRLSFSVYAPNFHEMKVTSKMDALIPVDDEYQLTCYRIQNFKNRWLPYVVAIDLGALEDVALGAGGEKMKPKDLLNMVFQTNVALVRKKDLGGATGNNKSIDVEPTGMATEFETLANDLSRIIQQYRDISGLNEVTDGSTPGERNLNSTNEAAIAGTNNALSGIVYADKWLLQELAKSVFARLQVAVAMKGNYSGYYDALGSNSLAFFNVSKQICLHYYGIKLEERTSDEEKQMMMQFFAEDIKQGLLSSADIYMITSMYNTKQAWQYLNYKVEANKAKMQEAAQQASALQQKNASQGAVALEKEKQNTQKGKAADDLNYLNHEKAWDLIIAEDQGIKTMNTVAIQEAMKIVGMAVSNGVQNGQMPMPPAMGGQQQQQPPQPTDAPPQDAQPAEMSQ